MKFLKDNAFLIAAAFIALMSLVGNGVGYKYFTDQNEKLQQTIDDKSLQIDSLEVEKQVYISDARLSQEREEMLVDSLKMSLQDRNKIKKYYENKYNIINTSSDDEYLEYLRSRVSPVE